ncbi:hypothetical protein MAPG_05604 [Magnaporthiopsis poae ATCC 64411]|uniref:Glycosyl transferase CAP10 domain-containing protein n=1 Tax=Magnaporthiopsis poae (strain ATCC 64411 / 73-15) TaxID=644358 RepID=A0A0C4DZU6_MAGP6|nr:hypothetical protein MAPG_05604 [Magnaporthiopsis poae ATCC 64411]
MRPILRFLSARRLSIVAVVVTLIAYNHFSNGALTDTLFRPPAITEDPPGAWDDHPVVLLHQKARAEFHAFLARQSKTPDNAENEYRRRYLREPPPGFRQWVDYALANESPVIDDFDIIAESVHPFLKYNAEQVNQSVRRALQQSTTGHNSICEFSGGRFGRGCRNWGEPLTRLLGDARGLVPDLELYTNFLDEPSVLLGTTSTGQQYDGGAESRAQRMWTDLSHQSIATAVAEACRARGEVPKAIAALDDQFGSNSPLRSRFVSDVKAQKDLCQNPQYASQHGFVMSPPTFWRLSAEVPMLSRAAPHPFSDVLFPATHYSLKSSLYSSWSDRSWGAKKNAVYWTGSSTGGQWSPDTWRKGHRQRLVALATGKTDAAVDQSRFDVAFTRIVGCAPASVCDDMFRFFSSGSNTAFDPESRPLRYRFALDVDGNSFSGRFYRLLASRSVPLKITIFREWHDERLRPWVHYVPVSVGMEELPELVQVLTSTATGQKISKSIAEAGREWYQRAMAPKHQGIYLYRLMLEMARLQDRSREAG